MWSGGHAPRDGICLDKNRESRQDALMSWTNEIAQVLQQYSQSGQPGGEQEVASHFQQVAQAAPQATLASGLTSMFQSEQTPPFAQMIGQLFGRSNGMQRASLLNTLLSSGAASGILSQLAQSAGIPLPGGTAPITPETAEQITPDMAQQAAARAAQHDPTIIDRVSAIYAQHPALVKTLGAVAMSIALSHLANRRS